MNEPSSFVENVLEQLDGVDKLSTRRMFGGIGIYRAGVMFGLISDDRLYFKVDAVNKIDYQEAGSYPFIYNRNNKTGGGSPVAISYFEVPPDVLENRELLYQWMLKAHEAAIRAKIDLQKTKEIRSNQVKVR